MPEATLYQPLPVDYCRCSACRRSCHSCELQSTTLRETVSGDEICGDCAAEYYYTCNDCDRLSRAELTETSAGTFICDSCASTYWGCEGCSELINDGDYCDGCEPDDDECACGSCCSTATVHGYSYKPVPEFHGDGPLYLGIELEVEVSQTGSRRDCIHVASDGLGELGYLKEDSSLTYGFEIVTHPMSHDWASRNFPWGLLQTLTNNGACAESTAGLHVHVSREAFDGPAHVYRWLKLLYRNEDGVTRVARRTSHDWAPFDSLSRRKAKDFAKGNRDSTRYAAVNVTNSDTFELRAFASTLDEQELRAAIDLAAASVEYTRTLTVGDIARRGGWEWSMFREWVDARCEYAALAAEMSA